MSDAADPGPAPEPFLHADSGAIRFWVRAPGGVMVGASARKELLHHRLGGQPDGSDALDTFHAHRQTLEAAVLRRVAAGAIEPVLLREADLGPPAPR